EHASLDEFIACLRARTSSSGKEGGQVACSAAPHITSPVAGRRVLGFGDRTRNGIKSKGIVTETAAGALISPPAPAVVLFPGGWRSYGNLLIIDAGCNVDLLIGGQLQASVGIGAHIARGAAIGKMSEYASPDLPALYLEVRENGTAVNPER